MIMLLNLASMLNRFDLNDYIHTNYSMSTSLDSMGLDVTNGSK